VDAGVVHRFPGGGEGEIERGVTPRRPVRWRFSAETCEVTGQVQAANRPDGYVAVEEPLPQLADTHALRGDRAHPGDDDPFGLAHVIVPPFSLVA
jgi:hypothetical protein